MSEFLQIDDDAPLRRVLFSAAILLIVVPFLQAVAQLWPLQLSNIQWRYGAANALTSILLLPFLGLSLLLVIARATEGRGLSKTVGVLAAIFAVGLAASLVLFTLDALQLKAIVNSAQMQGFMNASIRVGIVSFLFIVCFSLLALAGLKTPRTMAAAPRKGVAKEPDAGAGLIVGRA